MSQELEYRLLLTDIIIRLVGPGDPPPTSDHRIFVRKLLDFWASNPLGSFLNLLESQQVQSITSAVVNFLSAMALVNNGVREILPFVRYIAQFIDYEFTSIKAQNKGKGVVCAATWSAHFSFHSKSSC